MIITISSVAIAVISLALAVGLLFIARWDASRVIDKLYKQERDEKDVEEVRKAVSSLEDTK